MKPVLPNVQVSPLDASGRLLSTWVQFFRGLVGDPPAASGVSLPASPATIEASDDGHFLVAGGAVSGLWIVRGRISFNTGLTVGLLPVSKGDQIQVIYTVAPTVTFIPS